MIAYLFGPADTPHGNDKGGEFVTDDTSIAALRPGLRVMISAGAAGIGRAMAEAFTRAGARVHICDIDEAALAACVESVPGVAGAAVDMADANQIGRWFDEAQAVLGGLDVMVNNAGIAGPTAALEDISPEDWERTIAVNLNSMFYCARRAIPLLKEAAATHGDASMINLSSTAGRYGFAQRTPYSASKWAVVGLTKSLSIELGGFDVRVNAIQPGPVAGDRIRRVIAGKATAQGRTVEEVEADMTADLSLHRLVPPEDIANMALFLCSQQARSISNQALSVCADMQKMP